MNYLKKLFDYVEKYPATKNIKCLREFIVFLQREGYGLEESAEKLSEFKETSYFSKKSKYTQCNYLISLKRFVEYIYESEGYSLYPLFVKQEPPCVTRITGEGKTQTLPTSEKKEEEEEAQDHEHTDKEYEEFLRKYEKLTQDGGTSI